MKEWTNYHNNVGKVSLQARANLRNLRSSSNKMILVAKTPIRLGAWSFSNTYNPITQAMCLCLHTVSIQSQREKCLTMQKQVDIWGKKLILAPNYPTPQLCHSHEPEIQPKTQPTEIKKSLKQSTEGKICLTASAPHQSNGNYS